MKTYNAISRKSGKKLQVKLGLVEKSYYVNIADVANVEHKTGIYEPEGKAIIPGYGEISENVQIYMFDNKLVFKANDDKVGIDCFVEGCDEIEDFFRAKKEKSEKQAKEWAEFKRNKDL